MKPAGGGGGIRIFGALLALVLASGQGLGATRPARRQGGKPAADNTAYHVGTELYSKGKLPQALSVFRGILRRNPNDEPALAAVNRIEEELAEEKRAGPPAAAVPEPASWLDGVSAHFDDFVLAGVGFDEALGDALTRTGTLEASQGRVAQLLAERKVALAKGRPFEREEELRSLVRRMPAVVA